MKNPFGDIEGGGIKGEDRNLGEDGKIQSFLLLGNNSKGGYSLTFEWRGAFIKIFLIEIIQDYFKKI